MTSYALNILYDMILYSTKHMNCNKYIWVLFCYLLIYCFEIYKNNYESDTEFKSMFPSFKTFLLLQNCRHLELYLFFVRTVDSLLKQIYMDVDTILSKQKTSYEVFSQLLSLWFNIFGENVGIYVYLLFV